MPPTRRHGWYALGLLAGANFFHYANRNVVITMYDDLRAVFSFSNAELGLLGTAFMLPHAFGTLFFGWLADRVDRRYVIAAGVAVWSAATLLGCLSTGLESMLLSRAAVGLGTATCVPVANALICDVFADGSKARSVAVFNLGLFLGGLAGTVLGRAAGFPLGFVVVAVPGFAIALGIARLAVGGRPRSTIESPSSIGDLPPRRFGSFVTDAVAILAIPTMRFTMLGATLMAFAAGGYLAWFFDFLVHERDATEDQALALLAAALVAGLIGVVAGGVLGDRLRRRLACGRQLAIVIGFASSVPAALAVLHLPLGVPFYVAAWLLMFFISWYHGPLAASVDDLVPGERAATAQGLYIAVMHLAGTAPSSYLVGRLADAHGLTTALLAPTAAMLLAALAFAASLPGVAADSVVQTSKP